MNNTFLSFQVQAITYYGSQLVSTYFNLSLENKLTILTIVVAVLVGIVTIVGVIYPIYRDNQQQKNKQSSTFNTIWKNSTSITKDDIITLSLRPFVEYYYSRDEDKRVRDCLKQEKNVLILGSPLAGKTRMVYEALRKSKKYDLIILRSIDVDIESFILPWRLKKWKPKLMFIDDLQVFVENKNFTYIFEKCKKNNIKLIATCRLGIEYEKTKKIMLYKNFDLESGFFDEIITITEILEEHGKKIAENVNRRWNEIIFNETVGSIFMPLNEMRNRFKECTSEEKCVLRAIKKLYVCGVYNEDQVFQVDQIKRISENEELRKKKHEWVELLNKLCEKEFTKIEINDMVRAEEVYLENIVQLNYSENDVKIDYSEPYIFDIFEELNLIFIENPEVLVV
jgi:hypothetical protein